MEKVEKEKPAAEKDGAASLGGSSARCFFFSHSTFFKRKGHDEAHGNSSSRFDTLCNASDISAVDTVDFQTENKSCAI